MENKYTVDIPATAANVGACFDFAGLAIPDLYNTVEVELGYDKNIITVEGVGEDSIPTDESNLIYRTFKRTYEYIGKECPHVKMHCINRIPLNRGLGSSAAAILGGIFAANATLGNRLLPNDMFKLACEYEGHPDNVAPAIFARYGGIVLSFGMNDNATHPRQLTHANRYTNIIIPCELYIVVVIPEIMLSTSVSRSVLPESYSRKDVVTAMSTATAAIHLLEMGAYEDFGKLIMQDVIHIPYRKTLIKGYDDVVNAAMANGAYGTVISGAGSTMISYCKDQETADMVKNAMIAAFETNGVKATGFTSLIE